MCDRRVLRAVAELAKLGLDTADASYIDLASIDVIDAEAHMGESNKFHMKPPCALNTG